ncbi:hypothetical protein VCSRO91_2859 [Vibrio cholerae]|nr:hypothetical protein VCSRO91_2859 [Vibrio cholerae]
MIRFITLIFFVIGITACATSNEVQCGKPYTIIDAMLKDQLERSHSTEN